MFNFFNLFKKQEQVKVQERLFDGVTENVYQADCQQIIKEALTVSRLSASRITVFEIGLSDLYAVERRKAARVGRNIGASRCYEVQFVSDLSKISVDEMTDDIVQTRVLNAICGLAVVDVIYVDRMNTKNYKSCKLMGLV
ncbi:hypothetical protein [Phascolarctobacterium sp.]